MLRRFPFIEWKKLSGQARGVGNLVKFREQDDWGKKSRGPTLSSETGIKTRSKAGPVREWKEKVWWKDETGGEFQIKRFS